MSADLRVAVRVGAAVERSFNTALRTADKAAKQVGAAFDRSNRTSERSNTRLTRSLSAVERRYRSAGAGVRAYAGEVRRAGDAQQRLTREAARTERAMRGAERRKAAGAQLRGMRGAALGAAGVGYGFARAAGAAMERQEQAVLLGTVINAKDGDRDAAVGRAVANARQVGRSRDSLASEREVLEIEYALNSASLDEETARVGTAIVHRLAKVTRGAPERVGEVAGMVYNTMGKTMEGTAEERMGRIANILAKTQFKFQIRDFGQLGESFKSASKGLNTYGVSAVGGSAALGVLSSAGLAGSEAGTALTATLVGLSTASEQLGTQVVRDAKGQLDLVATFEQIEEALQGMGTQQRGDLLKELFGVDGLAGVSALLTNMDMLRDGTAQLREAAQSDLVNKEYERFLESSSGRMLQLRRNVAQVGVTFAGVLLPAIDSVVTPLANVASHVGAAIERYPVLGRIVGGLATAALGAAAATAAYAGAAWVGGAAAQTMAGQTVLGRAAMAAWGLAMKVGAATTGLFSAALWANPIVWIGAAVVAAGALIWRYWQPLGAFFSGFGSAVGAALAPLKPVFKALAPIGAFVGKVIGWVGEKIASIFEPVQMSGEAMEGFAAAGRIVGKVVGTAFKLLLKPIEWVIKGVGAVVRLVEKIPGVRDALSSVGDAISSFVEPEEQGSLGKSAKRGAAVGAVVAATAAAPSFGAVEPPSFGAVGAIQSPAAATQAAPNITVEVTGPFIIEVPGGDPNQISDALRAEVRRIFEQAMDEAARRRSAEFRLASDDGSYL